MLTILLNQFDFAPEEDTDYLFFNFGENGYIIGVIILALAIYLIWRLYKKTGRREIQKK